MTPDTELDTELGSELDSAVIEDFRRDGAVALRNVFSPSWIDRLRRGLERNMATPGPYMRGYSKGRETENFFGDYCNWRRIPEYEDFVRHSPAGALARALMGSRKANFFHEHVLVKEPGTPEKTPWHHDQPYYCVDGDDSVSLWMPLDPVAKAQAVEFIAGSHRWGRLFRPTRFVGGDYDQDDDGFEPIPDIDAERHQHCILSFDLQPGDCVAFHFRTVHGAPGNASASTRRRAISWRWTGDDARYALRNGVMSPPFHEMADCPLKPGDVMDCDLFPAFFR